MARNWYIMPLHYLSHINPTLTTGAAVSGYPVTNMRGLMNPNVRGRATSATIGGGNYAVYVDFDRATTAVNPINAVYVSGLNVKGSGYTFGVYSGTTSTPATERVAPYTLDSYLPEFHLIGSDVSQRYWRAVFADTTGSVTYECGVFTAGYAYSIPGEVFGSQFSVPNDPRRYRGISIRAVRVPAATGKAIVAAMGKEYIHRTDGTSQDGIGGASGKNNIVLGYFDDAATVSTDCWFGPASVSYVEQNHQFGTLSVSIEDMTVGPLL